MNTSFLYHAFGIKEQECSRVRYEDKQIVLNLQTKPSMLRCPCCKTRHFVRYGTEIRHIKSVPIASKPVILEVKQQRLYCLHCHKVVREHLHFVTGKHCYTNKLANLVLELSRVGTIKDVARFLHLSWDTVKDIQKKYLKHKYKNPDLNGIRYIGIDEFAVAKGHKYKTIVARLGDWQSCIHWRWEGQCFFG